jgi:hypothetical protein
VQSYSLAIYRGDTCGWRFVLWSDTDASVPVDLSAAAAAAQIRTQPDSLMVAELGCTITLPNIIDVSLPAAESALAESGQWDLQLTFEDGTVQTVVGGRVRVTADITV